MGFKIAERLHAFALYGLPFSLRAPRTTMERLRQRSLRYRLAARKHLWQRVVLFMFCACAYPAAVGIEALRNWRWLKQTRPGSGVGVLMRMYGLALTRNIPPVEYVFYDFENPARKALASHYLYWMDGAALPDLNAARGADNQDVQDKARFAAICESHGIPHVRSLGVFRRGEVAPALDVLDGEELWVKPISLWAGQGAELWVRRAEGYQTKNGSILTREALHAKLSQGDFLLQRRLKNHPAIEALAVDGQAVILRVVTGLSRDGHVELLGNLFGLPAETRLSPAGAALVNLRWEDGCILQRLYLHGSTVVEDVSEAGMTIPLFAEAVALCRDAHAAAFPKFVTLGWDVALSPEGPLLLETNSEWGSLHMQMVCGPLGQSALPMLVEEEWARATREGVR
jgi:hypothetical protein